MVRTLTAADLATVIAAPLYAQMASPDMGDRHVMVPVEDLRLVPVDDQSYSYVTRLSEEQLKEMEGADEGWFD